MVSVADGSLINVADGQYTIIAQASDGTFTGATQSFTIDVVSNLPTVDLDGSSPGRNFTTTFTEGGLA